MSQLKTPGYKSMLQKVYANLFSGLKAHFDDQKYISMSSKNVGPLQNWYFLIGIKMYIYTAICLFADMAITETKSDKTNTDTI